MQTQSNGYNCGMFAIAFVTDVFNGLSPVNSCFDITLIHSHLIQFLETEVTVFPKAPNVFEQQIPPSKWILLKTMLQYECKDLPVQKSQIETLDF